MDLEFHCKPTPIPGVWGVARLPFDEVPPYVRHRAWWRVSDCFYACEPLCDSELTLASFADWLFDGSKVYPHHVLSPREGEWHHDCGGSEPRMIVCVLGPVATEFRHRNNDGSFREFRGEPGVVYVMENVEHRSPLECCVAHYPDRLLLRWRAYGGQW